MHGSAVAVVTESNEGAGEVDALVTAAPRVPLAVKTADCAPIALGSPEGVVAAVHAGWRGLVAGVVEAAVAAMRRLGATQVEAALGPCIHAECYEFSADDLDLVARRYGDLVRGHTASGAPALDVPAAVGAAVLAAGASLTFDVDVCTACSPDHWSHRARAEGERQAMVVWRP